MQPSPCPHCQGSATVTTYQDGWRVRCDSCGSLGAARTSNGDAIASWNTRSIPTEASLWPQRVPGPTELKDNS